MNSSLTTERGQAAEMEKKTRELQNKIDMMNAVENVRIFVFCEIFVDAHVGLMTIFHFCGLYTKPFNLFIKEITTCLRLMEECESEMQRFEKARDKVMKDKEAIDTKNSEQKELNVKGQVNVILHDGL